jgi:hypothetical protein
MPSNSGDRGQEDCVLKPAWANSSQDPTLKNIHHTKGLLEWLKVKALSSSHSTAKKKKKQHIELNENEKATYQKL